MLKSRSRLLSLLLLLFLSLMTVLHIGDFNVRLANTHGDDNPVVYAYFLQDPARFEGDILTTYGHAVASGSLQNWLPAVLLQTLGLPPEIPAWVFFYLQNVLLGFAVLLYARRVTGRNDIAWLTVFFTYTAQPMKWNLANYGFGNRSPYAGHLALPIIIFAAAAAVEGHFLRVVGLLVLSGLIHPSLTLYMVVIVGGFWLLQYAFRDWRKLLERILLLGVVAAVCVVPAMLLQSKGADRLTPSELMVGLRLNMHAAPWTYPPVWSHTLPTFSGFMILTGLAFRHRKETAPLFTAFWLASLGACVLLALLHLAGLFWGIPQFVQAIPLRATLLLVMFSLPLVMAYLAEKLRGDWFLMRWAAAALLLLVAFFGFGVFWGPILALLFSDLSEGSLGPIKLNLQSPSASWFSTASWVVLIGWIGLIFATRLPGADGLMGVLIPGGSIGSRQYLVAIIAACAVLSGIRRRPIVTLVTTGLASVTFALAADWLGIGSPGFGPSQILLVLIGFGLLISGLALRVSVMSQWAQHPMLSRAVPRWINRVLKRSAHVLRPLTVGTSHLDRSTSTPEPRSFPVVVIIVILMSLTMFRAWRTGAETAQPRTRANYEAQAWARYNTAEDAVFIVYGMPWRTVSLRRVVNPHKSGSYFYSRSRAAKQLDDEYLTFYGLETVYQGMTADEYNKVESAAYLSLDEAGVLRLARRFGGDYIVRSVDHPLEFPEAYRNERLVIYSLPAP